MGPRNKHHVVAPVLNNILSATVPPKGTTWNVRVRVTVSCLLLSTAAGDALLSALCSLLLCILLLVSKEPSPPITHDFSHDSATPNNERGPCWTENKSNVVRGCRSMQEVVTNWGAGPCRLQTSRCKAAANREQRAEHHQQQ